jgi:hypothetical protein
MNIGTICSSLRAGSFSEAAGTEFGIGWDRGGIRRPDADFKCYGRLRRARAPGCPGRQLPITTPAPTSSARRRERIAPLPASTSSLKASRRDSTVPLDAIAIRERRLQLPHPYPLEGAPRLILGLRSASEERGNGRGCRKLLETNTVQPCGASCGGTRSKIE